MFCLAILKDKIPIHPQHFSLPPSDAIISEINKKYANRILHDVGLCVCLFDLVDVGDGKVRYGDGFLWYKVTFRMVIFRPFVSEVVIAKVKSSDEDGIRLTMGFFDDMYIPESYLPQPSAFDPNERAHFWLPSLPTSPPQSPTHSPSSALPPTKPPSKTDLLDTPTADRMYIDQGEILRVRVELDEFYDDEPGPIRVVEGVVQERVRKLRGSDSGGGAGVERARYSVVCSIAEQGLGPVAWWNGAQIVEEDGDDVGGYGEDTVMG